MMVIYSIVATFQPVIVMCLHPYVHNRLPQLDKGSFMQFDNVETYCGDGGLR